MKDFADELFIKVVLGREKSKERKAEDKKTGGNTKCKPGDQIKNKKMQNIYKSHYHSSTTSATLTINGKTTIIQPPTTKTTFYQEFKTVPGTSTYKFFYSN